MGHPTCITGFDTSEYTQKMAEKGTTIASQKLEDQSTSPVCLQQFTDPQTLPCLHSFCTECLGKLPLDLKKDGSHTLSCPICRTTTDVPQHGITGYPKAFHINNLIEVHELMNTTMKLQSEPKICSNCNKEEATGYCPECENFFCQSCNDIHSKWGPTSNHKLVSAKELLSGDAFQLFLAAKPAPSVICPSHNKSLDLYCTTCQQPISYHCTIKGHKGHTHDLLSDTYEENKRELRGTVAELTEKIEGVMKTKEDLEANQTNIKKNRDRMKDVMAQVYDAFIAAAHEACKHCLQDIDRTAFNKVKFEEQQLKIVKTYLDVLQHHKAHAEHCLQVDTPIQLPTIKQEMAKVHDLLESDECDLIEPIEEIELPDDILENDEELEQLITEIIDEVKKPFIFFSPEYSAQFYKQCDVVLTLPETVIVFAESVET